MHLGFENYDNVEDCIFCCWNVDDTDKLIAFFIMFVLKTFVLYFLIIKEEKILYFVYNLEEN